MVDSNYARLIELLNRAKGDRSLNQFAIQCGVDPGHMSRLMRGKMLNPPTPDTLKKIAEKASNSVSYEELMAAAGHLSRKFIGKRLAMLRGARTYEEFSRYIKEKTGVNLSPRLLEIYEKALEKPDDIIVEQIAAANEISTDFFYQPDTEEALELLNVKEEPKDKEYGFMDKELSKWVSDPDNYPYLQFIYKAYKAGVTKELLEHAEISVRIK